MTDERWQGPPPVEGTEPERREPFPKWGYPLVVLAGGLAVAVMAWLDDGLSDGSLALPAVLLVVAIALVAIIAAGVWLGIRVSRRS